MKNFILSLAIALAGLCACAATDVQSLAVGKNVLVGGPGKVVQIEAVASSASGTVTVKRVIDTWTYAQAAHAVTNSFTNAVSWATQTVTNTVVATVDDFLVVTNSVYTNVVGSVTNYVQNTTYRPNGFHYVTNGIVVTRPVWTTSYMPFKTSSVTNDVVSHAVYTNTVGTITISNHVGTITPSNLFVTGGDVILMDYDGSATFRLYTHRED